MAFFLNLLTFIHHRNKGCISTEIREKNERKTFAHSQAIKHYVGLTEMWNL